jgi:hypothetical protein
MQAMMFRARVKPDSVADVEASVHRLFSAIEREQPKGIRYASCRLADGETYVILLQLTPGTDNPLEALPEFRQFQQGLRTQLAEPPTQEQLTVVGSYRLFE